MFWLRCCRCCVFSCDTDDDVFFGCDAVDAVFSVVILRPMCFRL